MKLSPLLLALATSRNAVAFMPSPPLAASPTSVRNILTTRCALPTANQASTDDFMKQLGHASQIIPLLHPQEGDAPSGEELDALMEVLSRQLSHSDGIRGFFAVYLTSPESQMADEVPSVLAEAVRSADSEDMVSLACMNVIMPTAMSSVHKDAELKECAAKTASSGKKILRLLKGNDDVTNNCKAIFEVCQGSEEGSDDLIKFWEKFFVNYKYEDEQKKDIALAVSEFC